MTDLKFAFRQLLKNAGFSAGAVLLLCAADNSELLAQSAAKTPAAATSRPFRMGFTAFPHDITAEALNQTRQFVRTNADLIAHHIEGVPWAEALRNEPFPKELMSDRETKRSMTPPGAKVYLAVSPGRGELKLAEKGATPLPPELRGKAYDDPLVKKAYLNYCRRSIEFFKPDYLAIGIEVNEIFSAGKDKWRAYVDLHGDVYRELKKEHPSLPIFASYTLHNLIKARGEMLKACQELMPFNDFVAVSFYPFFISDTPDVAFQWLVESFDPFGKPYAIVETNDTAERLEFPQSKLVLNGTPEKQAAYVRTLLALAEERRFRFVVLFIHQDYDALWDAIKATAPELFIAWRDCGLIDERGRTRPAYAVWRGYLNRPFIDPTQRPN
jgi:hypothetical protein